MYPYSYYSNKRSGFFIFQYVLYIHESRKSLCLDCLNKHKWEKLTVIVLTDKNWIEVDDWLALGHVGSWWQCCWLNISILSSSAVLYLSENKSLFVRHLSENIQQYSLTFLSLEYILLVLIFILTFFFFFFPRPIKIWTYIKFLEERPRST